MNDNDPFAYHEDASPSDAGASQDAQLAKSRPLAEKAILHPTALTPDEITDLGWGLFVALRRLREHERGAAWDAETGPIPG